MGRKPAAKPAPAITLANIGTIVTAKAPKKGGLADKLMDGIADLTAIGRVIADLEAAEEVVRQDVREAATKLLLDDGCGNKARPANFYGVETEILGGVELRHSVSVELRNYAYPLNDET